MPFGRIEGVTLEVDDDGATAVRVGVGAVPLPLGPTVVHTPPACTEGVTTYRYVEKSRQMMYSNVYYLL